MSRGLSARQKRLLALLVVSKRPLDVTGEASVILGGPDTRSARVSLLDAVRSLERRGLVEVERAPDPRGGWGKVVVAARPGAAGELTGANVQRARGCA
jgi:hypothetical protein